MADSAAATVKMSKEEYWPYKSSKWIEEKIKFKLSANRITSTPKRIIITFLKLNVMPIKADTNIIKLPIIGFIRKAVNWLHTHFKLTD